MAGSQDGSLGLEWAGEEVLAGWRHGGKIKMMMMMRRRSRRSREIDDDLDNNDDDRNNSWHRIKTVAIILDNDKTNQIPKNFDQTNWIPQNFKVKMVGVCKGAGFTIGFGEVILYHLLK